MAKALVIVESPAKAKTINKYLGKQYVVKASLGHVKDLPKRDLAVDVENGFEPRYEVIEGKKKLITELKAAAKKVDEIYLAADPDREGEAICYHLQEELDGQEEAGSADLPRDVQRDHEERDPSKRSKSRCRSMSTWWRRSRRGACWTGWWATKFLRCCGTKCGADCRRGACRRWRCG